MRWRWEIGGEEDEGENPRALVSGDSMTQDPSYPMRWAQQKKALKGRNWMRVALSRVQLSSESTKLK